MQPYPVVSRRRCKWLLTITSICSIDSGEGGECTALIGMIKRFQRIYVQKITTNHITLFRRLNYE